MSKSYVVALYLCDRAYGGHEEGGWWFDYGQLQKTLRTFRNEDAAYDYCRRFNHWLNKLVNVGYRRDINSVCCEGAYSADVYENVAPAFYPEQTPHYE